MNIFHVLHQGACLNQFSGQKTKWKFDVGFYSQSLVPISNTQFSRHHMFTLLTNSICENFKVICKFVIFLHNYAIFCWEIIQQQRIACGYIHKQWPTMDGCVSKVFYLVLSDPTKFYHFNQSNQNDAIFNVFDWNIFLVLKNFSTAGEHSLNRAQKSCRLPEYIRPILKYPNQWNTGYMFIEYP